VIASVAWKEYREHRTVWFFMALVASVLVVLVTQVYPALNVGPRHEETALYLLVVTVGAVLTYGIVCGSMLLAGEREGSTLAFLDALLGQRLSLWFAKLLPGVFFCLLQGLVIGAVAYACYPTATGAMPGRESTLVPRWFFPLGMPVVALDAFAWGLLASALCQSVLTAAGLAALFWLLGLLLLVPCGFFDTPLLPVVGRLVTDFVMLALSATAFCQMETAERESAAPAVARRVRPPRPPSRWLVLAWLPLRQGLVLVLVLTAAALLLGLGLHVGGALYWSSFTMLVGVLCGASVFGSEQSEGSNQFLGNQRFPLGQVWAVKTGLWLVVAVGIVAAFVASGFVSAALFHELPKQTFAAVFGDGPLLTPENAPVFLPLALLYGFAIGQYYALLWRKTIVAVVLALLLAPGFVALWLPSLVFGGLHFWQVLVPFVFLLLGTRLVVWAWCSTGLAVRRAVFMLIACGAISVLWLAAATCYRFWEVPITGEPVDAKAVDDSMPKGETNEAGLRMRTAGQAFKEQLDSRHPPQRFKPRGGLPSQESTSPYAEQLAQVVREGWPLQDADLDRWLDAVFTRLPDKEKSWPQLYGEAAAMPLGVVDEPLTSSLSRELPSARRALDAGTFLEARAVQLQAFERDAEALDQIVLILGMSRQLRNFALTRSYGYGRQLEAKAMDALDRWLAERRSPELLRRALAMLEEHEQQIPPVSLSVKAEHVRLHNVVERGELFQSASSGQPGVETEIAPILEYAPWERLRHLRVLNALTEAGLRVAELEPRAAAALLDTWDPVSQTVEEGAALDRGLTLLKSGDPGEEAAHWSRLLNGSKVASVYHVETLEQRVLEGLARCRRQAARLKIALLLYQLAHQGQSAPDLQTVVTQQILAAVPLDPFDGKPFRYRLSDGRDVSWTKTDDATPKPAASGVLWSVGPDGIDHGGRNAGQWRSKAVARRWQAQQLDAVFLVPSWAKP